MGVHCGEQLGRGQAYLVTDRAVARDCHAGLGGGMGVHCREQLGRGQAHLITYSFVTRDGQASLGSGLPVKHGQQLSCRQAHFVADPVIAGDGAERRGCGPRFVGGELLGCGYAVFVAVVVHGLVAFCSDGFTSGSAGSALLDVFEDFLHLVELVAQVRELHVDLGEFQVGVLLGGNRHF